MGNRWQGVQVNATDPARLSRWWAQVLGYRILHEAADTVAVGRGDGHPVLVFARAGAPPAGPGRLHLDIGVTDREAEVERLVNMGARQVESGPDGRLVLCDPEGNEFALLRVEGADTLAS
jgi:hypothetical protein